MFNPQKFITDSVADLTDKIDDTAIVGISGGVDSTVAAVLVGRAVGKKLVCVLVDTGYMRLGEIKRNKAALEGLGLNVIVVDASKNFYKALKGIMDPEKKRKIIGKIFIDVFEKQAKKVRAKFLVQGTIAPDWIESGGGLRDTIKSHHNVGGLPKKMGLLLVEPLRDLYKDEVRLVGKKLGLPASIYQRQPFPGPGLAVRVIGEASEERAEIVRQACAIVEEQIEKVASSGLIKKPWQYFAVLLPVKSVGVHGDTRVYKDIISVRVVASEDGMSAKYARLPHEVLENISVRITNQLKNDVGRVVYDITDKPPGTIEYE